jgi:hypothetical protein
VILTSINRMFAPAMLHWYASATVCTPRLIETLRDTFLEKTFSCGVHATPFWKFSFHLCLSKETKDEHKDNEGLKPFAFHGKSFGADRVGQLVYVEMMSGWRRAWGAHSIACHLFIGGSRCHSQPPGTDSKHFLAVRKYNHVRSLQCNSRGCP